MPLLEDVVDYLAGASLGLTEGTNLWMVPVPGGTPVQITKGLGYVDFPMMSGDGRTLVFGQERTIGHLWLAALDGSMRREEIYSSEQKFEYPDISPDGKFIGRPRESTYTG